MVEARLTGGARSQSVGRSILHRGGRICHRKAVKKLETLKNILTNLFFCLKKIWVQTVILFTCSV